MSPELLQVIPEDLRKEFQVVLSDRDRLQKENDLLRQAVRLLQIQKFGKRSEKLSSDQLDFLAGEVSVTEAEVESEAREAEAGTVAVPKKKKKNQNHPGRIELPPELERREVIIPCSDSQKLCSDCGHERPVIGYEVSEELAMEPIVFFVRVTKREKRGSHCRSEQGVATAPCPPKIILKSKLSNEVIVDAIVAKFEQHMPVYRQAAILERDYGVEISRTTINSAIMQSGRWLEFLIPSMKEELVAEKYIQADETPTPCQGGKHKGKNHQAFMWEYSRPGKLVIFDFQMGRSREGPLKFLRGFKGILQCDGFAAYDKLGEGITYAGCWSHVRRQFDRAARLAPKDPVPLGVLKAIGELYDVERQAREAQLSPEKRLEMRKQISAPLVEKLKSRIEEIQRGIPPGSQLAKACKYALGQWKRLLVFLTEGVVEIDNNWCENAIRPIALGRKNWLHIGGELAGPKIAAIASIVETCHRLEINVRQYLLDVLPKLPEWPMSRVRELTPSAWKAAQSK